MDKYTGFYFRLRPQAKQLLDAAAAGLKKDRTAILHELIETQLSHYGEVSDRIDALVANAPAEQAQ